MRTTLAGLTTLTLAVVLAGCGTTGSGVACTADFRFGITVSAVDSLTRQPVTAGLTGTLTEGAFRETMQNIGGHLVGAGERKGTYAVTVSATGYRDWTRTGVKVDADECHVQPVALTAELARS